MAGSSAEDMLDRYSKLIEHGDPLARHIDEFVHYSLERVDMLERYSRLIEHRGYLAQQVDELVQQALAHRIIEAGGLAAVKSGNGSPSDDTDVSADLRTAVGEALGQSGAKADSPAAVKSREGSPIGHTDDLEDKDTAVGEAVTHPNAESSVKHRSDSPINHVECSENSDTLVVEEVTTSAAQTGSDAANTSAVVDTAPGEAIATSPSEHHSAHISKPAALEPAGSEAVIVGIDGPHPETSAASRKAVGTPDFSSDVALDSDPSVISVSSKTANTESKSVSSLLSEVDRSVSKSPTDFVPTSSKAGTHFEPLRSSVQRIVENSRKRKSSEEHEAVDNNRKPFSIQSLLNDSDSYVAPMSSIPHKQKHKHTSDSSSESPRRLFGRSMIAIGESALSRPSSISQHPEAETMHKSTDAVSTDDQSLEAKGARDISAALTAAWAGSKLINISAGTSANTFVLHLQETAMESMKKNGLRRNSTYKTVKDARTEFISVIHATVRVPSATRLQAGILRIVKGTMIDTKDCDFTLLHDDASQTLNESTFRARTKALYQEYDLQATKYCDGLWGMVRKMMLAYKFISIYEEAHAKRSDELVNAMIADLFPSADISEINSSQQISRREAFNCKLAELKSYHEIATICGGPGIFCILPEKCLTKIRYARATFRMAFLQSFVNQYSEYKELGSLLTRNVLTPVIDGDKEALKRLPLFGAKLDNTDRVETLTWHELLSPPLTG